MRQALRPGALGRPRGIGWRGRGEGGLGWGTHVYPWEKKKRNSKKKKKERRSIVRMYVGPYVPQLYNFYVLPLLLSTFLLCTLLR